MILNMGGGGVVPKENIDETIITPGTEDQIIPSGTFLRGDMTISGDGNLTPENIVKGKNIFGVDGGYDPATADPDLIPDNIRNGVNIHGVTGTMIQGSHMSKGIINVSASAPSSESFTTGLRIAHGLGVTPSYVSMNITGNMSPGVQENYASTVYNFKSYVTGCLEWLYTFPRTSDKDFDSRHYYMSDTFTYLRVRVDANYIYIDYKSEWDSSGNYKTYGCIPKGTLHWIAVA